MRARSQEDVSSFICLLDQHLSRAISSYHDLSKERKEVIYDFITLNCSSLNSLSEVDVELGYSKTDQHMRQNAFNSYSNKIKLQKTLTLSMLRKKKTDVQENDKNELENDFIDKIERQKTLDLTEIDPEQELLLPLPPGEGLTRLVTLLSYLRMGHSKLLHLLLLLPANVFNSVDLYDSRTLGLRKH